MAEEVKKAETLLTFVLPRYCSPTSHYHQNHSRERVSWHRSASPAEGGMGRVGIFYFRFINLFGVFFARSKRSRDAKRPRAELTLAQHCSVSDGPVEPEVVPPSVFMDIILSKFATRPKPPDRDTSTVS